MVKGSPSFSPVSGGLDNCLSIKEEASAGGIIEGIWIIMDLLLVECLTCVRLFAYCILLSSQKKKIRGTESIVSSDPFLSWLLH